MKPCKEFFQFIFQDPMLYFDKKTFSALAVTLFILCFTACNTNDKKEKEQKAAAEQMNNYDTAELTIQRGMVLFNQHCASCHNFNENVIGPNLAGVTSNVSKDWLVKFIENPKNSIESGDQRAMELYAKYKTYMPSFDAIKGNDLEDLLGFIHKFSEGEKKNKNKRPGGILNPIPVKIPDSDLTLVIEEFLTVPPSSESPPKARINKLSPLKTEHGERLFIADLRGKLYEIVASEARTFMDLKVELDDFIDNPGWGTG